MGHISVLALGGCPAQVRPSAEAPAPRGDPSASKRGSHVVGGPFAFSGSRCSRGPLFSQMLSSFLQEESLCMMDRIWWPWRPVSVCSVAASHVCLGSPNQKAEGATLTGGRAGGQLHEGREVPVRGLSEWRGRGCTGGNPAGAKHWAVDKLRDRRGDGQLQGYPGEQPLPELRAGPY